MRPRPKRERDRDRERERETERERERIEIDIVYAKHSVFQPYFILGKMDPRFDNIP